jgi:protein tyrosine/serine phosphatase
MTLQSPFPDVALEGIANFRDFGGWPTQGGGRVRRGRLFRSAHHAQATAADLQRLADLGVQVVVDLRRPPERRRDPMPTHDSVSFKIVHDKISPDEDAVAPHLAFFKHADKGASWVVDWLLSSYRNYPFDEAYSAIYRDYFQALLETDAGVLVHCQAGKDRTGFLCALTLRALGVDEAAVHHDYLETNRLTNWESRLAPMVENLERDRGHPVDPQAIRAALSADLRYLEAAFAEVHARHRDLDAYLADALGVTPAVRERLRARLVTDAEGE